ncbi:hypothetical protein PG985_015704 [Apiospora marii]|uniref:uncharacterized protein n=1 Tax=Apiospora marii TaxID=335849 RepID=UPI00312E2503
MRSHSSQGGRWTATAAVRDGHLRRPARGYTAIPAFRGSDSGAVPITVSASAEAQSSLPEHAAAGEQFKYVCKGAVVNWWGWGTKADNRDSMVEVLC